VKFQRINLPEEKIAEFCRQWKITEFALFGSVLRDDFRSDSDIDVLVTFADDCGYSLFDVRFGTDAGAVENHSGSRSGSGGKSWSAKSLPQTSYPEQYGGYLCSLSR